MGIPLFNEIEKLINERGSANILRERLSLASDRYSALERKTLDLGQQMVVLENENSRLKAKTEQLESEKHSLEFDVINLRQEIQRRDDIIQKEKSHVNPLDEVSVNVLKVLFRQDH
jgi:predicted RNase H-like nuclease (RuvC/YqgF family)